MQKDEKDINKDNNHSELQECQMELSRVKDAYVHLCADFDNYKKRVSKDETRFAFLSQAEFLLKLLPIVDDFERAFKKGAQEQVPEVKAWLSGFEMINKALKAFLKDIGVQEVQMEIFDPEVHEAISQIEVEGKEPGQIVEYVEKGYKFKDQLLRPGKVAVSR